MSEFVLSSGLIAVVEDTNTTGSYTAQEVRSSSDLSEGWGSWAVMSGEYDVATPGNVFQVMQVEIVDGLYVETTGVIYEVTIENRHQIDPHPTPVAVANQIIPAGYGLRLMSGTGRRVFDSRSVTWNQVGFFIANANESSSMSYPAAAGLEIETMQFMIDDLPLDQEAISHTVETVGVDVVAQGGNQTTAILVLGR